MKSSKTITFSGKGTTDSNVMLSPLSSTSPSLSSEFPCSPDVSALGVFSTSDFPSGFTLLNENSNLSVRKNESR